SQSRFRQKFCLSMLERKLELPLPKSRFHFDDSRISPRPKGLSLQRPHRHRPIRPALALRRYSSTTDHRLRRPVHLPHHWMSENWTGLRLCSRTRQPKPTQPSQNFPSCQWPQPQSCVCPKVDHWLNTEPLVLERPNSVHKCRSLP